MWNGIEIIAEVKTRSPFGYVSDKSWDELFELANSIGDTVSIHTDERWGGSMETLKKAKRLTAKPILAKGIHATDEEIEQCLKAGADWVLVVGRVPLKYNDRLFIEPNTLAELAKIPENLRVVWNSRDLCTGGLKKESFDDARKIFKGWLCQASNIQKTEDIKLSANAVLIGSHIEQFAQSLNY